MKTLSFAKKLAMYEVVVVDSLMNS